ncbi:uncharacterized protein LOC104903708 isoform X2 [Beta vulgaris subsp. vulgaris]|uniref:uncharacterized protein LOC104903708 isoform X2 n=1 Tax=Beta vulgaris subsp. vulgaris TaxID=3555 RepID=UPI002037046B|nr:uncharacterized protein LOC104903708 isoform X2 [Beta vulgaris subsp. vulgaris]
MPFLVNPGSGKNQAHDTFALIVPTHIVTNASQLPEELLNPSPNRQFVVGFDCEDCILVQEQQGLAQPLDDRISFIGLLADHRFCGDFWKWKSSGTRDTINH